MGSDSAEGVIENFARRAASVKPGSAEVPAGGWQAMCCAGAKCGDYAKSRQPPDCQPSELDVNVEQLSGINESSRCGKRAWLSLCHVCKENVLFP